MKAAVLYGNEDIRYADWETPECRPGTVKVRVRATGICGSDVPRVLHHGAHFYPIVLGHEFSGDVVEVGEGVEGIFAGDTVSGAPLVPCMKCADCQLGNFSLCRHYSFIGSREQGSFAEYVVIPAANAIRYDPSIPYEQAAMFEPSTVAVHGLLQARYRGGETVAILGCGTIGIFTLQWAKILGAKQIVAFDIDDGRLELAKRLGYHVYFAQALVLFGTPYGNTLLSRFPILNARTVPIPDPEPHACDGYYETRCVLQAELDVPGGLRVCVTHFGLNSDEHANAVQTVCGAIRDKRCILMGDMNVTPENPILSPIRARMFDTAELFREPMMSFPSDKPDRKIDYIFTSRDWNVLSADIPAELVSDHRPYVAEIEG